MMSEINTYEDAIVEDKCVQAPLDEQCRNALKHYQGIARIAMHWDSLIEKAIKEYPTLKKERDELKYKLDEGMTGKQMTINSLQGEKAALQIDLADCKRVLGELLPSATQGPFPGGQIGPSGEKWYLNCPVCDQQTEFDNYEARKLYLVAPIDDKEYFCTNPDCPAVEARKLMEDDDDSRTTKERI